MPSFLNKERYVKVADMEFGAPNTYTDYEELCMRSEDPEWYAWLYEQTAWLVWNHFVPDEKSQDICDLVFYNVVHVLSSYQECDVTITKELVQMLVESSDHMVSEVLRCEWVKRADENWKERIERIRAKKGLPSVDTYK